MFRQETIFESHGKPKGLAVIVLRPMMTLRGFLNLMWNRERARPFQ